MRQGSQYSLDETVAPSPSPGDQQAPPSESQAEAETLIPSPGQYLLGFFRFFTHHFDWTEGIASTTQSSVQEIQRPVLRIDDPTCSPPLNLAGHVTQSALAEIQWEFMRAFEVLSRFKNLDQACEMYECGDSAQKY
eukprot:NODE_5051_length_724_cov_42.776296_g4688_i0.p1 GENE.NODE_5051_length_724_cov_42.776296_g4688_i0~~NODE_5051_length_724_cov_42.776296_g4688_i0.p1  ORF type:complete len:136 (-),score=14.31 NODE_5051_length_724_cov_42.776296_g4688_i0:120-527(-)